VPMPTSSVSISMLRIPRRATSDVPDVDKGRFILVFCTCTCTIVSQDGTCSLVYRFGALLSLDVNSSSIDLVPHLLLYEH
jgi:hypothetical protein